jgi:sugar/nucleoside kinase (ribokinase family)
VASCAVQLPDIEDVKRPEMLERLTADAARGDTLNWEAGAQSNFMIAAARLGLRVASAANVGQDVYGTFLRTILQVYTRVLLVSFRRDPF